MSKVRVVYAGAAGLHKRTGGERGGKRTSIPTTGAELGAGDYELVWVFRANPGDAFEVDVQQQKPDSSWVSICKDGPYRVPNGAIGLDTQDSQPAGYVPKSFKVA